MAPSARRAVARVGPFSELYRAMAVPCMKGRSSASSTLLTWRNKNIGTLSPRLVNGRVRMNGGPRIIQDTFDRVSAATALGTASEAGIDIAHAGPSLIFCDH